MVAGYGLTLVAGASGCDGARYCDRAAVPLIGPILMLETRASSPAFSAFGFLGLTVLGVAQLTATVLVMAGLAVPRRVFVPVLPAIRVTPFAFASGMSGLVVGVDAAW